MGLLVDGEWREDWYDTAKSGGRFGPRALGGEGKMLSFVIDPLDRTVCASKSRPSRCGYNFRATDGIEDGASPVIAQGEIRW